MPISKIPYKMAPTELRELKEQLHELLDHPKEQLHGSLRLCIDYREINKVNLKNKYPSRELTTYLISYREQYFSPKLT